METSRGLSPLARQVLPVLYQHRLVATSQLKTLLQPHAATAEYVRQEVRKLRARGLVATTRRRDRAYAGPGELLAYLTPLGVEAVEASGEVPARAYRISEKAAASRLQEHTLATVDAGLAFVECARERRLKGWSDECGPLHWEPEVAHRIRSGDFRTGAETMLVPDAVLSYTHHSESERRLLTYFLEIDRGTMPVRRLVAKLHAYALYRSYVPAPPVGSRGKPSTTEAWRDRYGAVFPRLLIVLAGGEERRLAARRADLRAVVDADARLQRAGQQLLAGVTTLAQLHEHGPFGAPIVTPLFGDPAGTDAFLQPDGVPVAVPA
jgi:hypothetical protein